MELLAEERVWLNDFIEAIHRTFPGLIKQVTVFGSKAREDATPDSDLDVLVIIKGKKDLKSRIRLLGYELALGKDVVPSIAVYTVQEIEQRREHRSPFLEAVEREGVVIS